VLADEVLKDPEFVESITRELHFKSTAGQFDYKNLITDYKVGTLLRALTVPR
jgi:hypothetical protein